MESSGSHPGSHGNQVSLPFRELLNEPQWEAVSHEKGPLLILAGAGSGKTRVITYRICYLINECNVPPRKILAVTFTNKAAKEMKGRVEELIGNDAKGMWISTFHATCVRILRQDIHHLNLPNGFAIFDEDDQLRLLKRCMAESRIDAKGMEPRNILAAISRAKNDLVSAEDFRKRAFTSFDKRIAELYPLYESALRTNNALDFDDLLLMTVRLFQKHPDVLARYQARWSHILVDEYQDTNLVQSALLDLLAAIHQNLCVVGDDDQSIYRWRGAQVENILHFEKRYHQARVIRLEQNYRSTKMILTAADAVIARNRSRKPKKLWTANEAGEPITLYKAGNEHDEASFVCNAIRQMGTTGFTDLKNFGILYRVNAQSRVLEEALRRQGIPYRIAGGIRFYDRKEVKDCIAYLKLINNPGDDVSLARIVNAPPRGIGKGTLEKVAKVGTQKGIPILEAMREAVADELFPSHLQERLEDFYLFVRDMHERASRIPASELLGLVLEETRYIPYLEKEQTEEAMARVENVKELLSATGEFAAASGDTTLAAFLDHVALLSDVDTLKSDTSAVTLMTLHSAKGLEFPVVFMTGMEQGVFPHSRSLESEEEMEEERRLCYVGMTRAKKRLFLTHAYERSSFGHPQRNAPSIFLRDIPSECSRLGEIASAPTRPRVQKKPMETVNRAPKPDAASITSPIHNAGELVIGAKVFHDQWGTGTVLNMEGRDDSIKVTVDFRGHKKKLMLKYARLRILS
ncbi:MAG: ATP-dependent helicase [bacterium]